MRFNDGSGLRTQNYTYDSLNRLATATEDSTWRQTYVYDQFGNRALYSTSSDPSAGVDKILLPMTASLSSVPFTNNRWNGTGVVYDGRGNLTTVPQDAQDSFQATYDAENRNTSVTATVGGTSQTVNYVYDGDGKRVQKTVGSVTTTFVYDAFGHLAAEYGGANSDSGTQYLTADHLGSTRLMSTITNGVASAVSRSDYLPFGQEIPSSWNRSNYTFDSSQRIKFTSKERDAETGLDWFESRYFSGAQGRFTSPDGPFNDQDEAQPQSWNLYAYTRNNPLRFVDPNGKECVQVSGGFNGWADDGTGTFCNKVDTGKAGSSATVGVGRDEANLIMLQMIGEQLSSPHQWADLVSNAGQAAATVLAPGATAIAQCATGGITGSGCDKSNVALAMIPHVPGVPGTAVGQFAKNRKLRNILAAFNRTGTGIGTGSTADAIRYELQTGSAVGGKFHYTKGVELRDGLLKLWRNPSLDPSDRAIVKELLSDLQEALSRK